MCETMTQTAAAQSTSDALTALRRYSTIVADSGDFEAIRAFKPTDATTNPTLVRKAVQNPAYAELLEQRHSLPRIPGLDAVDQLMLLFGRELMGIVQDRVSTEVDARLSFDTSATVTKARALIDAYTAMGVPAGRILIKVAATWEGIRAAEVLEAEGIRCNMTLVFSLCQAQACFDAGATLLSPFVGRITDWHKQARGVSELAIGDDPGVQGVRQISAFARAHGYPTEVMAASFRHTGQVLALAGVDLMTISPELLDELSRMDATVPGLADWSPNSAGVKPRQQLDHGTFSWQLCRDAMASDRLFDGLRRFADDQRALEASFER